MNLKIILKEMEGYFLRFSNMKHLNNKFFKFLNLSNRLKNFGFYSEIKRIV